VVTTLPFLGDTPF